MFSVFNCIPPNFHFFIFMFPNQTQGVAKKKKKKELPVVIGPVIFIILAVKIVWYSISQLICELV